MCVLFSCLLVCVTVLFFDRLYVVVACVVCFVFVLLACFIVLDDVFVCLGCVCVSCVLCCCVGF